MNYTEAVNEVLGIVKRPDKLVDVQRAVNAAINFCCIEGNFARDRQEQTVPLDATAYAQNIQLSLLTRFRKVDCMRPSNRKEYLRHLDPSKLFVKGCEELDVYYIAGDQINLKLKTLATEMLIAYFSYPPVLLGTQTFWLLDTVPYMIIDRAAAQVFNAIGDDKSEATHRGYFMQAFESAKADFKYGVNYG